MKLTFTKIQKFSYLSVLLLLTLITVNYYISINTFISHLKDYNKLSSAIHYTSNRLIDLLISKEIFEEESEKNLVDRNVLKSLVLLKRWDNISKPEIKQFKEQFNKFYKLKNKFITAVYLYAKTTEEFDPNLDSSREIQAEAKNIISSSIVFGRTLVDQIKYKIGLEEKKEYNYIYYYKIIVLFFIGFFTVVGIVLVYFQNFMMNKYFVTIANVTNDISNEKFDISLDESNGGPVGLLNFSINKMKNKIQLLLEEQKSQINTLQFEVTERKKLETKNAYLARHDTLTLLPNRLFFHENVEKEISRAKRYNKQLGFLIFDVDFFKNINDIYGHDIGDELLKKIAERLIAFHRKEDIISRLGGDEFAVVVPEVDDFTDLNYFCKKLLNLFKHKFIIDKYELLITVSVGVSVYPQLGDNIKELYKNADIALYEMKKLGRNGYNFFSNEYNEKFKEHIKIINALRFSITNNEMFLVYQPIINMKTKELIGSEVLLRWNDPEQGVIPPDKFIPLAESTGLIVDIGKWIIDKFHEQLNEITENLPLKNFYFSLNLSPQQLKNDLTIKKLISFGEDIHYKSEIQISLELTETDITTNMNEISQSLYLLTSNDFKVFIDDFGTGNSSFQRINNLPVSSLKIDKSFVANITKGEKHKKIVDAIINLSKNLELGVIAEGVESEEQMQYLIEQECVFAQGFYFYKPMTFDKLYKLLSEQVLKNSR